MKKHIYKHLEKDQVIGFDRNGEPISLSELLAGEFEQSEKLIWERYVIPEMISEVRYFSELQKSKIQKPADLIRYRKRIHVGGS